MPVPRGRGSCESLSFPGERPVRVETFSQGRLRGRRRGAGPVEAESLVRFGDLLSRGS